MVNKKLLLTYIILLTGIQLSASTCDQIETWLPENKTFLLDSRVEILAKHANAHLNSNPLFNTKLLRRPGTVRKYLTSQHRGGGTQHTCRTVDGETIDYTYFNRNNDRLVVIGAGFSNPREFMAPFVGIFDCDILIFDHRGHGHKPTKWYNPFTWKFNLLNAFLHIDGRKIKMGEVEHLDVIAVVEKLKKQKHYTQVCGLGTCYSALTFIKAQALYKKQMHTNLFDKLICDGTWLSLAKQIDRMVQDPKKLSHPHHGGWHRRGPLRSSLFRSIVLRLGEFLTRIPFSKLNVELLDYIPSIDIPILFFHSKNDGFAPLDEFQSIWNHTTGTNKKVALITSNQHVRSHLKQKELYKLLCDSFIELEFDQFIDGLQNPKNLVTQELAKYQKRLCALS